MIFSKNDLIKYRRERALETLEEAKLLFSSKHYNTCANRLYYSAFYAILAYFAKEKIMTSSHSGVKTQFHQNLIKTNLINIEFGKLYSDLFNKRQESDYEDFIIFQKKDVETLINDTEKFINEIFKLIDK